MIGAAVESALTKTTSGQAFNYVGWTFYLCGCGGILALITAILFIIHLYLAVYYQFIEAVVVLIVQQLDSPVPVQSVPITTNIVSSNHVHGEVYSIQHYVIKFVRDLRQVGGFLRILRFPPPIKLTLTIYMQLFYTIIKQCIKAKFLH